MKRTIFTSESVTEGHPDKVCDQISDAILDAVLREDPNGRVACETMVTTGLVVVAGELSTSTYVDITTLVRKVVKDIGYTRAKFGFDGDTCGVMVSLKEQSADIAMGVDEACDQKSEGAGDQGMMFGFACDETPSFMPLAHELSHRLARELAQLRKDGKLSYLRPDGKTQVSVEYENDKPVRIHTILVSTQHSPRVSQKTIEADLRKELIEKVIPAQLMDEQTRILINPTGRFVIGGPQADAGLTGRKIIVDTYGGMGRHGGGCFSGKDPTKVDRSGAYAARHLAKNIVASELATRAEVQLSYAIGMAKPISLRVDTFGTSCIDEHLIEAWILENVDLTPRGIIDRFDLRRPIYLPLAAYGHFGRDDLDVAWERPDLAAALQELR